MTTEAGLTTDQPTAVIIESTENPVGLIKGKENPQSKGYRKVPLHKGYHSLACTLIQTSEEMGERKQEEEWVEEEEKGILFLDI